MTRSHNDASDEYDEVEYTDNQTPVVEPCNLEHQRMMEEMELTAAEFRKLLMRGFSAHKVMNSGGLKSITVTLVTKENECFLTWDNSRKSNPRIYLRTSCLVAALKQFALALTCDVVFFR